MGYEGFSKPMGHLPEMNAYWGGKNEYLGLLIFFIGVPLIAAGRKQNEDALTAEIKTTNRYARVSLDDASAKIDTKWTA